MTTTDGVVDLMVKAMKSKTIAGNNIFDPRSWTSIANAANVFPRIIVTSPEEDKESLGPNAPQFDVTATVTVIGILRLKAAPNDQTTAAIQGALGIFQRQIERAVINDHQLFLTISEFKSVHVKTAVSTEGEQPIAQVTFEFKPVFYQGPEDFAPIDARPYTEIALYGDLLDVADLEGDYTPPFAYPVVPAPRPSGPDGRVEIGAIVELNQPDD